MVKEKGKRQVDEFGAEIHSYGDTVDLQLFDFLDVDDWIGGRHRPFHHRISMWLRKFFGSSVMN